MKLLSLKKDPNIKINNEITYYLNPDFVYLPGTKTLVNQDAKVTKNMEVRPNVFSPVSGIAYGLKNCLFADGIHDALVIENDFREVEKNSKNTRLKTTIDNILQILEQKNHRLLSKFKNQNKFTNIIINAIDDEPYVYNNIFILKENIIELLELFDELSFIYKSDVNYLVIKNTDSSIITECLNIIGTYPNIKLILVNDEYLIKREEFLLEKLLIKGSTLHLSTEELLELHNCLKNKDNSTKLITISGDALTSSQVFRVKKYISYRDLLDKYLQINTTEYITVINGLMQGFSIENDIIIDDNVFAINVMKKTKKPEEFCLNCGKCIEVCPKGVNPLSGKNKKNCINCGLCSYICPGFVNLKKKLKDDDHDEK